MKIDTSTIRMTSNEYYREKTDSERNTTIRFWDMDCSPRIKFPDKSSPLDIRYFPIWEYD